MGQSAPVMLSKAQAKELIAEYGLPEDAEGMPGILNTSMPTRPSSSRPSSPSASAPIVRVTY